MADAKKSEEQKFPSEVIDLQSKGQVYSKDSPLHSGNIEIKYMTAKEEDILTSQNLIKKGVVIEKLLKSLIVSKDIDVDDLILGDKNAIMVAARILAYGPEYTVEIADPITDEKINHTFNLADCPFKELPDDVDYSDNDFEFELPVSAIKINFKLLTGEDEQKVDRELKASQKFGTTTEITTRLRHIITAVNGEKDRAVINNFVNNMLSRDSLALRQEIVRISPDIELIQEVDTGGEMVEVDIPLTIQFFWPTAV
jgi:hypothetical protein